MVELASWVDDRTYRDAGIWMGGAGRQGDAGLALFTAVLAARTKSLATSSTEDVRAASRPVLIDAAGESNAQMRVQYGEVRGTVEVDVRNAGPGPALNVFAYVHSAMPGNDSRSELVTVGNLAPDQPATVSVPAVSNVDATGTADGYLFIRVMLVLGPG